MVALVLGCCGGGAIALVFAPLLMAGLALVWFLLLRLGEAVVSRATAHLAWPRPPGPWGAAWLFGAAALATSMAIFGIPAAGAFLGGHAPGALVAPLVLYLAATAWAGTAIGTWLGTPVLAPGSLSRVDAIHRGRALGGLVGLASVVVGPALVFGLGHGVKALSYFALSLAWIGWPLVLMHAATAATLVRIWRPEVVSGAPRPLARPRARATVTDAPALQTRRRNPPAPGISLVGHTARG